MLEMLEKTVCFYENIAKIDLVLGAKRTTDCAEEMPPAVGTH